MLVTSETLKVEDYVCASSAVAHDGVRGGPEAALAVIQGLGADSVVFSNAVGVTPALAPALAIIGLAVAYRNGGGVASAVGATIAVAATFTTVLISPVLGILLFAVVF